MVQTQYQTLTNVRLSCYLDQGLMLDCHTCLGVLLAQADKSKLCPILVSYNPFSQPLTLFG